MGRQSKRVNPPRRSKNKMSSPSAGKASLKPKSKLANKSLVPVVERVTVQPSKLKLSRPRKVKSPSPKKVNSSPAKSRRTSKKLATSCERLLLQEEGRYCHDSMRTSGVKRLPCPGSQELKESSRLPVESVCHFSVPVRKRKGRPRRDAVASKKRKTSSSNSSRTVLEETSSSEDKESSLATSANITSTCTHSDLIHQQTSLPVSATESKDTLSTEASDDPDAGIEDIDYGNIEVEYPEPSTPQQKMMRQLARQKQLEDMRIRETALAREERYQRRRGLVCPQPSKSTKHVQWKSESGLVEIFVYSAVSDSQDLESDVVPS